MTHMTHIFHGPTRQTRPTAPHTVWQPTTVQSDHIFKQAYKNQIIQTKNVATCKHVARAARHCQHQPPGNPQSRSCVVPALSKGATTLRSRGENCQLERPGVRTRQVNQPRPRSHTSTVQSRKNSNLCSVSGVFCCFVVLLFLFCCFVVLLFCCEQTV